MSAAIAFWAGLIVSVLCVAFVLWARWGRTGYECYACRTGSPRPALPDGEKARRPWWGVPAIVVVILAMLYLTALEWRDCRRDGGRLVRGLFWWECVR